MAVTLNYLATDTGKLVASGEGGATISSPNPATRWAIHSATSGVENLSVKHPLRNGIESMSLASGEHLFVFGDEPVAVTADNAASGYIGE